MVKVQQAQTHHCKGDFASTKVNLFEMLTQATQTYLKLSANCYCLITQGQLQIWPLNEDLLKELLHVSMLALILSSVYHYHGFCNDIVTVGL